MRVLLAEDDKRLGKLIQYMLEQNDIQVEWVTNGSDIYEYAMYTDYDILILDWMMPGETGVEACSRLRKDGYEKAILMLTARDSVEDRVRGLDGASGGGVGVGLACHAPPRPVPGGSGARVESHRRRAGRGVEAARRGFLSPSPTPRTIGVPEAFFDSLK